MSKLILTIKKIIMSKKLKLNLNKEVISDLQAKRVVGGNESALMACTQSAETCASFDVECEWSLGPTDYTNWNC